MGPNSEPIDFLEYLDPQVQLFDSYSNIDIIGFGTISNKFELQTILSWDKNIISKPYFIGFSIVDDLKLRNGTTYQEIGEMFKKYAKNKNLVFTGGNCISYKYTAQNISNLHSVAPYIALIAYPNSGEIYNQFLKTWSQAKNSRLKLKRVGY